MVVFAVAALVCVVVLAYRLWRVEDRVDALEQWAGADVHAWLEFDPDDED